MSLTTRSEYLLIGELIFARTNLIADLTIRGSDCSRVWLLAGLTARRFGARHCCRAVQKPRVQTPRFAKPPAPSGIVGLLPTQNNSRGLVPNPQRPPAAAAGAILTCSLANPAVAA